MYNVSENRTNIIPTPSRMQRGLINIFKFITSILICQAAGYVGSIFTIPAIPTWYALLNKPAITPPDSVFAPVWISLYLLMGIALFFVWKKGFDEEGVKSALIIFVIQLILNMLWSFLFFGLKSPLAGLIDVAVLWIAILLTIAYFYDISRPAGLLLAPYLAWVSYASVLNYFLWRMNP